MTNKKSTKRALLLSVLSLLLCVSMLIGSTFAWFTDSVTSGANKITAGNLDVDVYYGDPANKNSIQDVVDVLFQDIELWEPGAMVWEQLTVVNNGSLALKYAMNLNVLDASIVNGHSLTEVLKVAVLDAEPTRESIKNATLLDLASFVVESEKALLSGDSDTFYVAIYWAPTANDNDYNVPTDQYATEQLSVDLGINVIATQYTHEEDSFDDQYDVVDIVNGNQAMTLTANEAPALDPAKQTTTVDIPANTYDDGDEISIAVNTENSLFAVSAANAATVASLDVTLSVNGEKQEAEIVGYYTVTTYISTGLTDVDVVYTGTDGRDQPIFVSYDAETGKLVFKTNHFSEYAVFAKAIAVDVPADHAYTTAGAVVEALKVENAGVTLVEDLTAADKVALKEAITAAGSELKTEIPNVETVLAVTVVNSVEELKDALANGGSILLGADLTITETIEIRADAELALGEYTLTCNVNKARAFKVAADGVDFVLNADGATVNFGNGTYGVVEIADNLDGATVTVNNGTFAGTTDNGAFVKLRDGANNKVTLNNVTYTDNCAHNASASNAFVAGTDGRTVENYNVTINGGTYNVSLGFHLDAPTKLTMNGVTLNTKGFGIEAGNAEIVNCTISVKPGNITNGTPAAGVSVAHGGNIVVKGTEINSDNFGLCALPTGGIITAENCTIKAANGNKIYDSNNGKINFVGAPVAWVEELEDKNITTQNNNPIELDCAYTFLPTQSYAEVQNSPYKLWHADFVVTIDKSINPVGNAGLAGYYSAWCEGFNGGNWFALPMNDMELPANEEFRLVQVLGEALGGEVTVSYEDICEYAIREENITNGGKNGFLCGAYADKSMAGVTMNVQLRLYEVTGSSTNNYACETGNYIVIGNYSHTFDAK